MSMIDKEYLAKKYFDDIKPKYLKEFHTETPAGNIIDGVICKKANHFLGSMVITSIHHDEDIYITEQFIHAMPKIHYWDKYHSMFEDSEGLSYHCYEKLDGSCLILYGIYTENNELLEIVPKTRGVPVADNHIVEMYNELDHANIESFFNQFSEQNPTLLFELYGVMNLHSIFYPEVRISMALIGSSFEGKMSDDIEIAYVAAQYDFNRPTHIFSLVYLNNEWRISLHSGIHTYYLIKGLKDEELKDFLSKRYPTQYDAIIALKDYITKINKNYAKIHKRNFIEGVCVNTYNNSGENPMYLKIKSSDIEELCRTENGIPRKFILKEVQKYFDEYGSQAKDIYKIDPEHSYNYIMKNLSEEFDKTALDNKKTKNRVKNVFLDVLDSKQPPKGLQEICRKIVEENPGQDVVDYIRLFAQEYPEKKRQASIAYSIFESLKR